MTVEKFRELALSFPGAEEKPHFDRTSFRAKKIFATLLEQSGQVTLKLSDENQSLYATMAKPAVYPVPNKWGTHGWTIFELPHLDEALVFEALTAAYQEIQNP